mmetsp:Transcript_65113/g.115718  ORF Transcript_65113/g.115718 Transcript_65113/m.115718 type:complete len:115 (-) Transcript_65113:97-441(-)
METAAVPGAGVCGPGTETAAVPGAGVRGPGIAGAGVRGPGIAGAAAGVCGPGIPGTAAGVRGPGIDAAAAAVAELVDASNLGPGATALVGGAAPRGAIFSTKTGLAAGGAADLA